MGVDDEDIHEGCRSIIVSHSSPSPTSHPHPSCPASLSTSQPLTSLLLSPALLPALLSSCLLTLVLSLLDATPTCPRHPRSPAHCPHCLHPRSTCPHCPLDAAATCLLAPLGCRSRPRAPCAHVHPLSATLSSTHPPLPMTHIRPHASLHLEPTPIFSIPCTLDLSSTHRPLLPPFSLPRNPRSYACSTPHTLDPLFIDHPTLDGSSVTSGRVRGTVAAAERQARKRHGHGR